MTIALTGSGLRRGDQAEPLLAGALHYFRIFREDWAACLDGVQELGLTLVESYVPWALHETAPGRFDFTGEGPGGDDRLDLLGFLAECTRRQLGVILRPGPHVNAELTDFGFPARLLDDPHCQARTAQGTPAYLPVFPRMFPIPSYASRRFLDETRGWIEGLAEAVRPLLAPAGPVVALQVDNEQSHFFRLGAYDLDYHPDAIAGWKRFLRGRYGDDLARLRACHAVAYPSFESAEPPRRFEPPSSPPRGLARHLDWMAYKDESLLLALGALREIFAAAGLDRVPLFHNFPPADPPSAPVARAETLLGFAGVDFYHQRREYRTARRRALFVAGSSALPSAPELGCGMMLSWPPINLADQATTTLNLLMHGLRAASFYMLVERERWYGSPIARDGRRRTERFAFYEKLFRALRETGLVTLRRDAPVGLVVPRAPERLAAVTSLASPITPLALAALGLGPAELCPNESFGLSSAEQIAGPRLVARLERALSQAHLPYVLVDEDVPVERLRERRAIVLPTLDLAARSLLGRLVALGSEGLRVVLGPRRPCFDELLEPLSDDELAVPGSVWLPEAALDDDALLARSLAAALDGLALPGDFLPREPDVDASAFRDEGGVIRVVFLGTDRRRASVVRVTLPAPGTLTDAIDGARFSGTDEAEIPLPAYGVRMLRWLPAS